MSVAVYAPTPALVAKTDRADRESYLALSPAGQLCWVDQAAAATVFSSMREAMRMAMRLPSNLRAFGVPRTGETLH